MVRKSRKGAFGLWIAPKRHTPPASRQIYKSALNRRDERVRTHNGRKYLLITLPMTKATAQRNRHLWSHDWYTRIERINKRRAQRGRRRK